MAYYLEKSERCTMCGTAKWEWDEEQGGSRFAYEAAEELCQGCLRKAALSEEIGSNPGVTVILIPTNTVEYQRRHQRAAQRWQEDKAGRE